MHHTQIQWPEGIDEQIFLSDYWQKKPLLIRQALADFETPLPAEELAGLSLEAETTPRLILRDKQAEYRLEHGPFDEERFATLTGNDWSLLVTDVEKHLPELASYLQPFRFLPDWRIDDLMVSYAPVGASVGAHTDEYDVFLLQASGARQWSIDQRSGVVHQYVEGSELQLLADFRATDSWELQAGDMLYLPPGIPHHGVASQEPCTTWSIGFRAPTRADLAMRISEMICESLPHERFADELQGRATPGEIDAQALARLREFWQSAMTPDAAQLNALIARFLTESSTLLPDHSDAQAPDLSCAGTRETQHWQLAAFSRIAWYRASEGDDVQLFIDGDAYSCRTALAERLSNRAHTIDLEDDCLTEQDRQLLETLIRSGALQPI